MTLSFCKMHGLGNDFIIIDATQKPWTLNSKQIRQLANRHTGIGFDQLLLIEKTSNPAADFNYRIFNADGKQAEQCGNGARCVARYIFERGLLTSPSVRLQTTTAIITAQQSNSQTISVTLGMPRFPKGQATELEINGQLLSFTEVDVGNPHAVMLVEQIKEGQLQQLGQALNHHAYFPQGVNLGCVQVLTPTAIELCVYERGAGLTHACGSGACAAVAACCQLGLLERNQSITVKQRGGSLTISWPDNHTPLTLCGPASFVFDGKIDEKSDIIVELNE